MQEESFDWRANATAELRNHLVYKIIQSVLSGSDPRTTLQDSRMQYVIAFAKNVEKHIFDTATSRSEYYHLLAEKIYKIQQELESKVQKRLENAQLTSTKPLNELSERLDCATIVQSDLPEVDPNTPPASCAAISFNSCDSQMESVRDHLFDQHSPNEDVPGLSATSFPASSDAFFFPLMVSRDPLNPPAQLPAVSITGSPITQPEQCKMVQQQLAFLIHARNCQQMDSGKNCPQPTCFQMKIILHHILSCKEDSTCSFVNCAFYKDINTHWSICKCSDCPLCLPVALEEILSVHD